MKSLLAKVGAVLLAAPVVLLVVQSAPQGSTASNAHSPAFVARAHAAFIKFMSSHPSAVLPGRQTTSPGTESKSAAKAANGTVTSLPSVNWSGFADVQASTTTFSSVSGTWRIPAVRCLPHPYQNQDVFLSSWVGLDGATNGTVEQLGTATQCFEDVEFYYVWYEMFPAGTIEEGTAACINNNTDCPQPGDEISASVKVTPGTSGNNNYVLALTDHTRPQESFSTSQTCAATTCLDQSAEWILERPAFSLPFGFQILPLGDFGATGFQSAHEVSGGVRGSIGKFQDGSIFNIDMTDDSNSYYTDCVGQHAHIGSLLTVSPNQCPLVAPGHGGSFYALWDSSF